MGKMNFNYSNKYRNNKTPDTEESENKEVVEEVENIEEAKMKEEITSTDETTEEIEEVKEVVEEKYGILQNCELLNVRKEANPNSEILKVFSKNDKIKILDEVGEFYKVLSDNTEAYCMKKFIKII